jgi:hypothetical protein
MLNHVYIKKKKKKKQCWCGCATTRNSENANQNEQIKIFLCHLLEVCGEAFRLWVFVGITLVTCPTTEKRKKWRLELKHVKQLYQILFSVHERCRIIF